MPEAPARSAASTPSWTTAASRSRSAARETARTSVTACAASVAAAASTARAARSTIQTTDITIRPDVAVYTASCTGTSASVRSESHQRATPRSVHASTRYVIDTLSRQASAAAASAAPTKPPSH
ncbi:hypothetical protein [Georgenia sp. SUBG003]|uniref:hypothetical protein n=1 Tax=Georgenia sp. SUBG003 TaxID=1497974 RepID=UPI003AB688C0